MNAPANITQLPPTQAMAERAGLRLELAASAFHAHCAKAPTGDDDAEEAEFARLETAYLTARATYFRLMHALTGQDEDVIERRASC